MLTQEHAQALVHATAYDASGNKLGKIGQVYLDNRTQAPEWATVHSGFFGNHESFVPLSDAELDGDRLRLPFAKEQIKTAPELDPAGPRGGLSPEQELDLYRHYGIDVVRQPQPPAAPEGEAVGRTSSFGPATALAERPETFDEPAALHEAAALHEVATLHEAGWGEPALTAVRDDRPSGRHRDPLGHAAAPGAAHSPAQPDAPPGRPDPFPG